MKRAIDVVSFVKARRAQQTADMANGNMTPIINMISALQQQVSDLTDALAVSNGKIVDLTAGINSANVKISELLASHNLHTHSYVDVDNMGVEISKTTSKP